MGVSSSVVKIAHRLNQESVKPPRGRGWAPSRIREMTQEWCPIQGIVVTRLCAKPEPPVHSRGLNSCQDQSRLLAMADVQREDLLDASGDRRTVGRPAGRHSSQLEVGVLNHVGVEPVEPEPVAIDHADEGVSSRYTRCGTVADAGGGRSVCLRHGAKRT